MKINEIVVEVLFDSGEQLQVKLPAGSTALTRISFVIFSYSSTVLDKSSSALLFGQYFISGTTLPQPTSSSNPYFRVFLETPNRILSGDSYAILVNSRTYFACRIFITLL